MNSEKYKVGGIFTYEHIRDGEVIDTWEEPNLVVDQGLNYMLDSSLSGGAAIANWYVGLFKNNYTPQATDTAALFPQAGYAGESTTEYTESVRQTWVDAGPAAKTITNTASPAVFTFNTTVSIYGAFLVSTSTKGGLTGTLMSASKFGSVRSMISGDVLNIKYSLSISST